jgi:hypothetical protein
MLEQHRSMMSSCLAFHSFLIALPLQTLLVPHGGCGRHNMCGGRNIVGGGHNNNHEGVDGRATCLLTAAVASNTSTSMARCWAFPSSVQRYSTSGNLLLRDITQNRFPGKFCSKLMVCCDLRISNLGTNMKSLGFMLQFDVWSEIKCTVWLKFLRCDCDLSSCFVCLSFWWSDLYRVSRFGAVRTRRVHEGGSVAEERVLLPSGGGFRSSNITWNGGRQQSPISAVQQRSYDNFPRRIISQAAA